MKLLSWAHEKLLPSSSLHKNQHNADRLLEISTPNLACVQAKAHRDTHAEVLSIGTLGMGSLLCTNSGEEEEEEEEEEEQEEEEEDDDDDDDDYAHPMSFVCNSLSPNRQSMSSNRASTSSNRASTSSNRASISSNRESVSSVDIQKLQEELQKILYFKLGEEHKGDVNKKSINGKAIDGSKGKAKKERKGRYINDKSAKQIREGKERGVMPLHNFLEMPMDNMNSTNSSRRPPYKLLLMQSLKSKLLHYKLSPSLFDKLVKPKVQRDLQHGSTTIDKMLHLLRKLMHKRPHGRWKNDQERSIYEEDKPKFINEQQEEEEEEEERLKWAVAKSCRGSERFINYITSTLAQAEKDKKSLVSDQHPLPRYQHQLDCEEGGSLQLMLTNSPSLDNECWIKTDDEYLVLEL